jgi:ComF family protein
MSRVREFFESVLDAILPPRERTARTKHLAAENIPLSPTSHDLLGVKITTLMNYQKQEVQDLIQSLKYDGGARAAHLCAGVLSEFLLEEISSAKQFSQKKILLVPVPLHASRARERGFNQIAFVLQSLPLEFRDGTKSRLAPEIIVRSRATKQQTRLSRSERLSNVAGAFEVPDASLVKNTHVFLIDDVATTGATLANAATPLRRAGAAVTLLALARA